MSTTNEEYHNDVTRIGKSGLDLIAKSPAHYWARYLDPARLPDEPTAAMRLGTAVHHAILEPDEFSRRYKVLPELNLRATADKMKFQELQQNAIANNWTLVSAEDYALCKSIRDSVRRHPAAIKLLASGSAEQTFYATDPITRAKTKIRPDWLSDLDLIVDVKTTEDASPTGFAKSVFNFRYHVQAPFYLDNYNYATGHQMRGFIFIAVEKKPPYAVAVYHVPTEMLELGRRTYLENLQTYVECLASDNWPAYGDNVQTLQLPAWATR